MSATKPVSDTFCSIDDLLIERANNDPGEPIIGYPRSETASSDFLFLNAREIHECTDAAARKLLDQGLRQVPIYETETIGLLGLSNLEYMITMFALSRLGYTVFLLSPRLAHEALTNLLASTGCQTICYAPNLEATVNIIDNIDASRRLPILKREDYYHVATDKPLTQAAGDRTLMKQKIAFIMHSSGSTGLPKPIFQTHQACLQNFTNGHSLRAFLTVPLYHTHGHACLFRAIFKRKPIYFLNARLPLTSTNLITAMERANPEIIFTVPYALGILVESKRGIRAMQSCKIVSSAGSQIPDELGDQLVNHGIHLISHWGSTETGALMDSMRQTDDKDWAYMSIFTFAKPFVQMRSLGAGIYELVALDGLKSKIASNSDDPPNSYRTKDTFEAHPTKADRWKYIGRLDDRVTLTNGEKVLPSVMEGHLRQHSLIREAVVFGIGRALPGVLVFRSASAASMSDEDFVEQLWPFIDEVNSHVESFARVSKEMIVPLGAEVDYPQTDKGTIIRSQVYKVFEKMLDDAYERLEQGPNEGLKILNQADTERFIMESFKGESLIDLPSVQTDFFSAGVDSLQAIKMAAYLKRKLYLPNSAVFKANTIFEQATAERLAKYFILLQHERKSVDEDEAKIVQEMIHKYCMFPTFVPVEEAQRPTSVLLTGGTGSLGVHILTTILSENKIDNVYCLVRARSTADAKYRILSALSSREMMVSAESEKRIIGLPCDLGCEHLGIEPAVLSEMRNNVSLIIHNAWVVNFNLSLRSFEDQHIKGTHNLLKFALSVKALHPARFIFLSSISVASRLQGRSTIAEALLRDLDSASTGYGKSKLVAEHVVNNAATTAGVDSCVIRIGQIVGDSQRGFWNDSESIPLIIRSALTLGCLPELKEYCSWIPVDFVAKIVIELGRNDMAGKQDRHSFNNVIKPCRFYNLVNPKSFHWTASLLPELREAGLSFESVAPQEWMARLLSSEQDPELNPTIKLRSFYEDRYLTTQTSSLVENSSSHEKQRVHPLQDFGDETSDDVSDFLMYSTEKVQQQSKTMRNLPDLIDEGYIKKFLIRWLEKWGSRDVLSSEASSN